MLDKFLSLAKRLPFAPNRFTMRALILPHFWEFVARARRTTRRPGCKRSATRIRLTAPSWNSATSHSSSTASSRSTRGWRGLLVDGARSTYETMARVKRIQGYDNLTVRRAFLTVQDLGGIPDFVAAGQGRLGILSIDVDGVDYWLCKALMQQITPDLLVLEYNASLGTAPLTVPYEPGFARHDYHESGFYHGASITAFHKLLGERYALIDVIRGLNLVFVRKDLSVPALPGARPGPGLAAAPRARHGLWGWMPRRNLRNCAFAARAGLTRAQLLD